jgi:hypothetical protein
MQQYFKQFQSLTVIIQLELGITDGVSVSLVSPWPWRLAEDTLNIACIFLYCNHQVHRDFLITLYIYIVKWFWNKLLLVTRIIKKVPRGYEQTTTESCPLPCSACYVSFMQTARGLLFHLVLQLHLPATH